MYMSPSCQRLYSGRERVTAADDATGPATYRNTSVGPVHWYSAGIFLCRCIEIRDERRRDIDLRRSHAVTRCCSCHRTNKVLIGAAQEYVYAVAIQQACPSSPVRSLVLIVRVLSECTRPGDQVST